MDLFLLFFQDIHECFTWDRNTSELFHFLFSFFLFIKELAFPSDVSSIEFGCHIFTKSREIFTGYYICTNYSLYCNSKLSFWDIVFEFLAYASPEVSCSSSMYHHRECIHDITSNSDIHLDDVIFFELNWLIVETCIS